MDMKEDNLSRLVHAESLQREELSKPKAKANEAV